MKYNYIVNNLDCANCAKKIEDVLNKDKNIKEASLNFATSKLVVETDISNPFEYIKNIIEKIEPDAILSEEEIENRESYNYFRLLFGVALTLFGILINIEYISIILIILGYIIISYKTFIKAFDMLIKARSINENFLILISSFGALILNKTLEGMMVITLYEIGKILESRAVNKSRVMVNNLFNITSNFANIKENNRIKKVLVDEVKIGNIIVVKEGEKIPLDGIVTKGSALLDKSILTGESKLIDVEKDDLVLSGSINTKGLIEIKVNSLYKDSTVKKILDLVENASSKKTKIESFVTKYSKYYTLVVFLLSILVTFILPFIVNISYIDSLYKGLTFLVISCPCAIAISIPLSYFSSIGFASNQQILIKGSNYLDNIKSVYMVIFDKTGTITTGNFEIDDVIVLDKKYKKDDILKYIVIGESFSNHPIAKSILEKVNIDVSNYLDKITNYMEDTGRGCSYILDKKLIKIGNYRMVKAKDSKDNLIYLSIDNNIIGYIKLIDEIKPNAIKCIKYLKQNNIKVKIFSGDNYNIVKNISSLVGIEDFSYSMLPTDKYDSLDILLKNKPNNKLIMYVGDGVNDAPVLMLADIGVSMGKLGSDSATKASDIVIMNDDIYKIVELMKISKRTNLIILENLIFALGTKILVLILSIFGIASMWQAVFADVGVTILCILNTLRLLRKSNNNIHSK